MICFILECIIIFIINRKVLNSLSYFSRLITDKRDDLFEFLFFVYFYNQIIDNDNEYMQQCAINIVFELFKNCKRVEGIEKNVKKFISIINDRFRRFKNIIDNCFSFEQYKDQTFINTLNEEKKISEELKKIRENEKKSVY